MSAQSLSPPLVELLTNAIKQVTNKPIPTLRADMSLGELGLDSVAVMEMIGLVEEQLKVTFTDDELTRVSTLGDLAALIDHQQPTS